MKKVFMTFLFFTSTFLSSKAQSLEGVYSSYISKNMGGFNISQSAELIISKDENRALRYKVTNTTIDEYNGSVPRIETTEGTLKAINTQQYNFIGGTYGERGAYFQLSLNKPTTSIKQLVIFFAPQRGNAMTFAKQASLNDNKSENVSDDQTIFLKPQKIDLPIYSKLNENNISEQIYPIGWSPDGKFAFLARGANEASDFERIEFYIQDMVTDKIICALASKDINAKTSEDTTIIDWGWDDLKLQIAEKLNNNNIKQIREFDIMPLPIKKNKNIIDIKILNKTELRKFYEDTCISESSIQIKINNQFSKTIFSEKHKEYLRPLTNQIVGYFKSPYEQRVAFIYLTEYPGYEGVPTVLGVRFIGCDLNRF